jgi:hypothetical protein
MAFFGPQPVIRLSGAVFDLFRRNDPDDTNLKQATNMCAGVLEDKDVEQIAIVFQGRRDEAEIKEEHHPFRFETHFKFSDGASRQGRSLPDDGIFPAGLDVNLLPQAGMARPNL